LFTNVFGDWHSSKDYQSNFIRKEVMKDFDESTSGVNNRGEKFIVSTLTGREATKVMETDKKQEGYLTNQNPETALEIGEVVLHKALEAVEENSVNRWMEIASPALKSGGRPVAVILALGFVSIPLMVGGHPWIALVLAIGASATAVISCFTR
jgi:hypothetical protein